MLRFNPMKTLTVRDVPDVVYEVLRKDAAAQGRSLQAQIRWVLEKDVRLHHGGFMNRAKSWRKQLAGKPLGDTVSDIRKGRERA